MHVESFLKRLVGEAGELKDGERFDVGVDGLLRWLAKQQSNVLEASIEHYSPQEVVQSSTVHDLVKDLYDDCTLRMDRFFADACSLGIE